MSEEKADYNPASHMLNLKGKDYLPVAARIVWMRHDHPDAQIRTRLVEHDPQNGFALYRAEVTLPSGGYAEATATQSRKQFGDYLEKCETKAIGRALGFLGYGTMAAFEDEPDNPLFADAPVERSTPHPAPSPGTPAPATKPSEVFGPGIESGDFETIMKDASQLHQTGKPYETVFVTLQQHRNDMDEAQVTRVKAFLKAIAPKKPAPPVSYAG